MPRLCITWDHGMKIENILKKFWRTVKPLSGGLDRITCFMDNVPITSTVKVCNLFCGPSVELVELLVSESRFSPSNLSVRERDGNSVLVLEWVGILNIGADRLVHEYSCI